MAGLVVDVVPAPTATLVRVCGVVDLASIAQFRDRLETLPGRDTVMEVSEVGLLCAAGLGVLLDLQGRLTALGARLVLAAPCRLVRRVVTVLELQTWLPMAPTVDDALTSLRSAGRTRTTAG